MKGLLLTASLAIAPLTASAQYLPSAEGLVLEFQYISWCEENSVTTNDDQGKEKILADCSANNLTCELERTMVGGRPAIHALCR